MVLRRGGLNDSFPFTVNGGVCVAATEGNTGMNARLTPYGLADYTGTIAKVGDGKAVPALAASMSSLEIGGAYANRCHRVVRRKAGSNS